MLTNRFVRILFALVASIGGMGAAQAKEPIERSGNVYHQAVCPHAIGRGQARCFAHIVVDANGNPVVGRSEMPSKGGPPRAPAVSYTPSDLQTAYGISGNGGGLVAIVDAYGYPNAEADLAVYRSHYGLGDCTIANGCLEIINQSGGTQLPSYNSGWAQEQALDLDMVSAICPTCKIVLVEANSNQFGDLAAAANMAASKGPSAISNSYGGGESGSQSYAPAYDHSGVAVTVSAGDSGYGVQFPASAPSVVAVGGTTLTSSNGSWSESAWSGTGSGCSSVYGNPGWESDPGCGAKGMRMETDVSAVADPATGVSVYGPTGVGNASAWLTFGGTSVGAPLIAGIYGLVGVPNSTSYPAQLLWEPQYSSFLTDVTTGSNSSSHGRNAACNPLYYCTAGTGYDGPTGDGTPHGTGAF